MGSITVWVFADKKTARDHAEKEKLQGRVVTGPIELGSVDVSDLSNKPVTDICDEEFPGKWGVVVVVK